MVKTQIQLPDELYAKAKSVASAREISLAELTRRGLEYIIGTYGDAHRSTEKWTPPMPVKSGWKGLDPAQIKDLIRGDEERLG